MLAADGTRRMPVRLTAAYALDPAVLGVRAEQLPDRRQPAQSLGENSGPAATRSATDANILWRLGDEVNVAGGVNLSSMASRPPGPSSTDGPVLLLPPVAPGERPGLLVALEGV
mmetsp:Transcript_3920/g.7520  ORF Transcript_3920/g.7520 Transcript_3920/m.7520 type:complete len:114 (+) Transcript_3920:288-629(+)